MQSYFYLSRKNHQHVLELCLVVKTNLTIVISHVNVFNGDHLFYYNKNNTVIGDIKTRSMSYIVSRKFYCGYGVITNENNTKNRMNTIF